MTRRGYTMRIGLCLSMNLTKDIFGERPKFAVLIDPDHEDHINFGLLLGFMAKGVADIVLVGGSSSERNNIDSVVQKIKSVTDIPVLLFPGNSMQITDQADGLLLPSLISGRNSEYLIGKHVEAAGVIYESGIPVFPMGYILIDGGYQSAVSYVTQTAPIPANKYELAAQTALAGQLLGLSCIYLESGSGANEPAKREMIKCVRKRVDIPLIVGGGIRTKVDISNAIDAGANMVVLGTILEESPEQITSLYEAFADQIAV